MTPNPTLIFTWVLELAILAMLLFVLARKTAPPFVVRLTLGMFGIRLVLGQVLYFISAAGVPIFARLHTHDGFWTLAADAAGYDEEARQVVAFLHGARVDVYASFASPAYAWLIGLVYLAFGASPSYGLLLNAALAAACVPLAYVIALRCGFGKRPSVAAATALAVFPSSFAWSAQMTKDPLQWFMLFALLAGTACLLSAAQRDRCPWGQVAALTVLVVVAAFVTATIRGISTTPVLVISFILGLGLWLWRGQQDAPPTSHPIRRRMRMISCSAVLLLALIVGSVPAYGGLLRVGTEAALGTAPAVSSVLPQYARGNSSAAATQPAGSVAAPQPVSTSPIATPTPALSRADTAAEICKPASPLLIARLGFVATGGNSLVDGSQSFGSCIDVLLYIPRTLELTLLAPEPTRWFRGGGEVGSAQYLSFLDAIAVWLLFPGLVVGLVRALWRPVGITAILAGYILLYGFVSGFVVTNFGTLFRVRLQVILPAILIATYGWVFIVQSWRQASERMDMIAPLAARKLQ